MRLIDLGYPLAKFTDVAVDPTGFVVVFEDAHSQQIVFCQFNPDGSPRARDTFIPVGRGNAFPRVHVWDGITWLAYRHGDSNVGYLHNINTGVIDDLGIVYGNDPIAFGAGWFAYQQIPQFGIVVSHLATGMIGPIEQQGRPTGLAYVYGDGSGVVLVDDIRNSVPGMVNPRGAGECVVGENASGDNHNIARLTDKRECILWPGLRSYTPRIAADQRQYIVGTWGDGARLAMLEDADFLPVVVPTEPQPDTEFVPNPEGLVTPRQMHAFLKATATACIARDGGTLWWLRKSGERPDWGEWWFERDGYLGLLEDRSTGYRDCPDGVRRAPEDCAAAGYDAATLPLASYYWAGEEGYLWAPMSTEGAFDSEEFYVDYVWSNGDVWADVPVWISLEPGTGIAGGYPVFGRQVYAKREGEERNLWGESGWRRHTDTHSGLDVVNAAPAPAFPRGPFVEPRRTTPYPPIYQPLNTEPPTPEPPVPGYPDLAPIPRDQILDTLTWLRNEVYLPDGWEPTPVTLVHHPLDDEGIAAWLCDAYESVGRYKYGMGHQKAKDYVYAEIAKVVHPPQPTTFRGPIQVEGRNFVS